MKEHLGSYENLVILRSMSKDYGIAGLRLGYAMASEGIIKRLGEMRPVFSVNILACILGRALLRHDAFFDLEAAKIARTRDWFVSGARRMGYEVMGSVANFVLFRFTSPEEARAFYEGLKRRGIMILPLDSDEFSGMDGRSVRVCIWPKEEMSRVLEVI